MVTTTHFLKKCVKVPKIDTFDVTETPASTFSQQKLMVQQYEKNKVKKELQHKNAF